MPETSRGDSHRSPESNINDGAIIQKASEAMGLAFDERKRVENEILDSTDTMVERQRRARLLEVVALTRSNRTEVARLNGNPHRGMIPGGEDEVAYQNAIDQGEFDPEPVFGKPMTEEPERF